MDNNVLSLDRPRSDSPRIRRKPVNARLSVAERDCLRYLGLYHVLGATEFMLADRCGRAKASQAFQCFEKGLIDRAWMPRERTTDQAMRGLRRGPQEEVFKLTKAGLKRGQREGLIAEDAKVTGQAWNGRDAPPDIRHRLLIVRMMIEIRNALEGDKERFLTSMIPDFIFSKRRKATTDKVKDGKEIKPDLVFEIERLDGSSSTMFFVEIQNTRLQASSRCKSRPTVATKLALYQEYLKNPKRKFSGAKQSIVLYCAAEEKGWFDQIVPAVPWDDVGEVRKLVRLSTFEDIAGDVFGNVWVDSEGERRRIFG